MSDFLIEPAEPLVFAPPRSFVAGEAHRVRSQFPPSPFAFQAMIRTRLLHAAEPPLDLGAPVRSEIEALVGTSSELPPGWQIKGPYPARRVPGRERRDDVIEPWIPAPRFLLRRNARVLPMRCIESDHAALSDLGEEATWLGRPEQAGGEILDGWVGPANLRAALSTSDDEGLKTWDDDQWRPAKPPFVRDEFQPGLAIDTGRSTARHGLLYFAEALRFEAGGGLYGHLAGTLPARIDPRALRHGIGHVGRRGRLATFRPVERLHPDWVHVMRGDHLPTAIEDGASFWLIAATPVALKDNHRPEARDPLPGGVTMTVIAAFTGRPFPLGGLEYVTGRARPNRLYVPAGSAWAIRLRGGTPEARRAALFALHDCHPFGPDNEAAMGFGHILAGLGPRPASTIGREPR
ncbi:MULTISPECIES: type III-B CRISPR module-associated Cmr3 family protein [unclassified Bradyrhizobium]|uniref:type III-B CRISPR module-associated Cmr3 family protein n=1 Tax=unclassified Bradyrhizobium TaxID=2631580 RepID=UPI0028EA7200|nr:MULTISPECIES: type III-B CRISPR module-associated Cmr3 family protein [unclassified Bradyrhizobium]